MMFNDFKKACSQYLKNPRISFFEIKKTDIAKEIKGEKAENYVILEAIPFKGNPDIEGTKLRKAYELILKHAKNEGYEIKKSGWNLDDKAVMWLVAKNGKLEKTFRHYGPPRRLKDNVKLFKKRWKGKKVLFDSKGVSYVTLKREKNTLQEFVADLLRKDFIKKRAKRIKPVM